MSTKYTVNVNPGVNCFTYWLTLETASDVVASLTVDEVGAGVASLEHLAGYMHQDGSPFSVVVHHDVTV